MQKIWTNQPVTSDIAYARTLDASWYLDPRVFELERERIFARTWQCVARIDDLSKPGDYLATDVVGEPIVVLRDGSNQLRAYYNVCPHRAGIVARGKGNRKSLQCLYHGWTFDLEGCLLRIPGFEGTKDFDPALNGLKPVRIDTWGQYVFVNLDPNAASLDETWGSVANVASGLNWDEWKLVERAEYLIDCNWKVYIDNYAEGYHAPMAHPGLSREMNLDDYYVDTWRFQSLQYVKVKEGGHVSKRRYPNPGPNDYIKYHVWFPNFMIDEYPDNISVNVVKPITHEKTLLTFEWYFKSDVDEAVMESMVKFADEVQYEDIEICEYVQRGLKSRSYNTGRYSARHENGVHHFHQLVYEFMNNDEIPLDGTTTPRENWRAFHESLAQTGD
ncbi:MAG: aromatic ring-hydroxylating dioxygenase subunit alpha [bacterium]|nr:aromatic ring-hydroxylating dioxygenase subunit alpha [bacterium]